MSLRSLLVPLTGQPADEIVLDAAYSLARTFKAHILVASIRPDPTEVARYAVDWAFPVMMDETIASAEQGSLEIGRKAAAMFARWQHCHELQVSSVPSDGDGPSVSWSEHIGRFGAVLRDRARFSDLVVMRSVADSAPGDGDEMLEAAMLDAGRPVLLVPGRPVDTFSGTALIAWDGAREALHAVTAALPLLIRMGTVRILTIGDDCDSKPSELASFLAWHGIDATTHNGTRGVRTIGEAVLHEAATIQAGLVVMGGYHHNRTREILFGGTTRDVLFASKIPVLLAH